MAGTVKKKSGKENQQIILDVLRPHTPEVLEIVGILRKIIRNVDPELEERGYPVWKAIGLRDKKSGYVCGIFPFQSKVQLVFEWGVLLKDTKRKLSGNTKQIRYLEYVSSKDVESSIIQEFIMQTLALPSGKKDKEFMIQNLTMNSKSPAPKKKTRKGKS